MKCWMPNGLWFMLIGSLTSAQDVYFEGQVSGWIAALENASAVAQGGVRYIPSLALGDDLSQSTFIDALISLNGYIAGNTDALKSFEEGSALRAYRAWVRYAAQKWEIRIGLQKISFGQALLIRPLMWFDRLDPRDPLKVTTGVYSALFRYYFLNNANIWVWGLYRNNDRKGWEFLKTGKNTAEYGGRLQYPLGTGEIALTYHYRRFVLSSDLGLSYTGIDKDAPEHRVALDGKWDYEIGFWFESVYQHQQSDFIPLPHQLMLTWGVDYTFDIGNGLYTLAENFLMKTSDRRFGSGPTLKWSALSANYPVTMFDQVQTIGFYEWERREIYSFLGWQRSYDNWVFHLNLFWNPDQPGLFYGDNQRSSAYAGGKGIQFLIVFNH